VPSPSPAPASHWPSRWRRPRARRT